LDRLIVADAAIGSDWVGAAGASLTLGLLGSIRPNAAMVPNAMEAVSFGRISTIERRSGSHPLEVRLCLIEFTCQPGVASRAQSGPTFQLGARQVLVRCDRVRQRLVLAWVTGRRLNRIVSIRLRVLHLRLGGLGGLRAGRCDWFFCHVYTSAR